MKEIKDKFKKKDFDGRKVTLFVEHCRKHLGRKAITEVAAKCAYVVSKFSRSVHSQYKLWTAEETKKDITWFVSYKSLLKWLETSYEDQDRLPSLRDLERLVKKQKSRGLKRLRDYLGEFTLVWGGIPSSYRPSEIDAIKLFVGALPTKSVDKIYEKIQKTDRSINTDWKNFSSVIQSIDYTYRLREAAKKKKKSSHKKKHQKDSDDSSEESDTEDSTDSESESDTQSSESDSDSSEKSDSSDEEKKKHKKHSKKSKKHSKKESKKSHSKRHSKNESESEDEAPKKSEPLKKSPADTTTQMTEMMANLTLKVEASQKNLEKKMAEMSKKAPAADKVYKCMYCARVQGSDEHKETFVDECKQWKADLESGWKLELKATDGKKRVFFEGDLIPPNFNGGGCREKIVEILKKRGAKVSMIQINTGGDCAADSTESDEDSDWLPIQRKTKEPPVANAPNARVIGCELGFVKKGKAEYPSWVIQQQFVMDDESTAEATLNNIHACHILYDPLEIIVEDGKSEIHLEVMMGQTKNAVRLAKELCNLDTTDEEMMAACLSLRESLGELEGSFPLETICHEVSVMMAKRSREDEDESVAKRTRSNEVSNAEKQKVAEKSPDKSIPPLPSKKPESPFEEKKAESPFDKKKPAVLTGKQESGKPIKKDDLSEATRKMLDKIQKTAAVPDEKKEEKKKSDYVNMDSAGGDKKMDKYKLGLKGKFAEMSAKDLGESILDSVMVTLPFLKLAAVSPMFRNAGKDALSLHRIPDTIPAGLKSINTDEDEMAIKNSILDLDSMDFDSMPTEIKSWLHENTRKMEANCNFVSALGSVPTIVKKMMNGSSGRCYSFKEDATMEVLSNPKTNFLMFGSPTIDNAAWQGTHIVNRSYVDEGSMVNVVAYEVASMTQRANILDKNIDFYIIPATGNRTRMYALIRNAKVVVCGIETFSHYWMTQPKELGNAPTFQLLWGMPLKKSTNALCGFDRDGNYWTRIKCQNSTMTATVMTASVTDRRSAVLEFPPRNGSLEADF